MAKKEKVKIMSKERFSDMFSESFQDVNDYLAFLEEMEEASKRIIIPLKDIVASDIALGPILAGHVTQEYTLYNGTTIEAVAETVDDGSSGGVAGARMLVTMPVDDERKSFLLSDTGLTTLISRAGLDCAVIGKTSISDKEKMLNIATKYGSDKKVSALYREEKIRAFNGANTYVELSPCKMASAVVKMLNENYNGFNFRGGTYTHQRTNCSFVLTGDTTEILDKYETACEAIGNSKAKNLNVQFDFITSEIGDECATISVALTRNSLKMVLGSPIQVSHSGDASEEKFIEQLPQLLAKTKDLVTGLENLMNVEIKNPINCLIAIAKHAGLSKAQSLSGVADFQKYISDTLETDKNATFSAHDIFYSLQEILMAMRKNNVASSTIEKCEENIARVLVKGFDWNDFDVPVRPEWGVTK